MPKAVVQNDKTSIVHYAYESKRSASDVFHLRPPLSTFPKTTYHKAKADLQQ